MSEIKIIPTSAALGAEVRGVDAARPLDANTRAALVEAWRTHLVLILRRQRLTDPALIAFSGNFGALDPPGPNPLGEPAHEQHPEINIISNVVERGRRIGNLAAGSF